MMVVSLAFYGMSTFEGPLMSVRAVNSLSHYTEWGIGHVHSGALGWVGYISFGALYCLVPWLYKKKGLFSKSLVEWHFWISTIGIIFYMVSMWFAGIMEGLMWRAYNEYGFLEYSFVETVEAKHISYMIRALGGLLILQRRSDHGLQPDPNGARAWRSRRPRDPTNDPYAQPEPRAAALAPAE